MGDQGHAGVGGGLNPTASSFSFNPGTTAFVPNKAESKAESKSVAPPPPPSAGDLAAELKAMAAIAKGETESGNSGNSGSSKEVFDKKTSSTAEVPSKKVPSEQQQQQQQPPVAYTAEELAARKEKIRATLELIDKEDARQHMNVVFIGHVDAGKSTTAGQILFLTGGVDDRTIEKYEREAKEKNRESWYMAYIMDTNEEERAKGKTVEVGRYVVV